MQKPQKRNYIFVALLIGTVLTVLGTVVYMMINDGGGSTSDGSDSFSFIPAVWVPILLAVMNQKKNKEGEQSENEKKLVLVVVVILTILVGLGLFVALWLN